MASPGHGISASQTSSRPGMAVNSIMSISLAGFCQLPRPGKLP